MARVKTSFVCSACGFKTAGYSGRCPNCQEWNTLIEQIDESAINSNVKAAHSLSAVSLEQAYSTDVERLKTNISEIDQVFGGGIVKGSVSLLAGEPGIGKSTILMQIVSSIANNYQVLYVSAEESAHQVGIRAKRLSLDSDNFQLAISSVTDDIAATIMSGKYDLVVVDSIQAISVADIASAQGSVAQITNSTHMLTSVAKNKEVAVIIVGHVTKEGNIAGPKVLEHSVDVVMQLEGDRYGGFKLLRTVKNRFGSTNETAVMEMTNKGLVAVENPSAALLAERQASDGSVILATLEGSRPLLVEVQALVNKTNYGYPKRAASGFDLTRLNLLIAVLEKRTKLNLSDKDIYINIVGGIQINDPAADLAICMAIGSAAKGLQLNIDAAICGEVGLSGEVRHVSGLDKRLKEAKKLGLNGLIGPSSKTKQLGLINVKDVRSALNSFLK